MRSCIPYFIALASAVAAPSHDAGSRDAAYVRLRDEARLAKLLGEIDGDIKARRYADALKMAEIANAIRPNNPVILNAEGAALTELRRFDEATKALDAAIAADPKAFAPQFNKAEILSLQKKYSDAAVQLTVLASRFGTLPILKYKLYISYALAGQKEQARETLELMRYPEDGAAWYFAYAAELLQAGRRAEAMQLIAAAEAIHKEEAATYRDTLRETGLLK